MNIIETWNPQFNKKKGKKKQKTDLVLCHTTATFQTTILI